MGHPVCIIDEEKYKRNQFIFNFCFVLSKNVEFSSYEKIVRRVAHLFQENEEQDDFISNDDRTRESDSKVEEGGSRVLAICETIMENLNHYSECAIPLGTFTKAFLNTEETAYSHVGKAILITSLNKDEKSTLHLRLIRNTPSTTSVKPWHVPISLLELSASANGDGDLTILRVVPHINGIRSVAQIAASADANLDLTCQAVQRLLQTQHVKLLDIFVFSAKYVATPEIRIFLFSTEMQRECALFVASDANEVKSRTLMELYTSLSYGLTLKDWCISKWELLRGIDVRRLIVFGVKKGFVYRVHKYTVPEYDRKSDLSSSYPPTPDLRAQNITAEDEFELSEVSDQSDILERYLDRLYCFDEICTSTQLCEADVDEGLRHRKSVVVIQK